MPELQLGEIYQQRIPLLRKQYTTKNACIKSFFTKKIRYVRKN